MREVIMIMQLIMISLLIILDSEFRCYKYTEEDYASLLSKHNYQVKVKLSG